MKEIGILVTGIALAAMLLILPASNSVDTSTRVSMDDSGETSTESTSQTDLLEQVTQALTVGTVGHAAVAFEPPDITEALTKDTLTLTDDNGENYVHAIQWANTSFDNIENFINQLQTENYENIGNKFAKVSVALDWVYDKIVQKSDEDIFGKDEVWATPENTLTKKTVGGVENFYGDCEDLAFVLASLLKFHCAEVENDDLVYVGIGLASTDLAEKLEDILEELPEWDLIGRVSELPILDRILSLMPNLHVGAIELPALHAWVLWYDDSECELYMLDPTINYMERIVYPGIGTLWFNDEYVWGVLPGYYPLAWPWD